MGILWKEKKGLKEKVKAKKDVKPRKGQDNMDSKIIVFIRHGESDWNHIFNDSKLWLLPRLVMGIIREVSMLMNTQDSLFIDSALSDKGMRQAKTLRDALANYKKDNSKSEDFDKVMKALKGDDHGDSVLCSSPLRRATATGCIGLHSRLQKTREKIHILSSLQEMARNVDTSALATKEKLAEDSSLTKALGESFKMADHLDLDPKLYKGNKGLDRRAIQSFREFCEWCFKQKDKSVIIVSAGHSIWFKSFFQVYLDANSTHPAANKKIMNCGVVAFNLERGVGRDDSVDSYKIDEDSITTLHMGFEKKGKAVDKDAGKTSLRFSKGSGVSKTLSNDRDRDCLCTVS